MTVDELLPFVSSLAIGLLVGFERERSHRGGVRQAAGSRTFAVLALAGTLAAAFDTWVIAAGLIAAGGLLVVGYRQTGIDDPGATTEIAGLATYLLGALAWTDAALAAGIAIILIVLLASKGRIHSFARDMLSDADVDDAIKFLVMAFVVLPLLPDREMGPYGVLNPERIWQLVLALTAISWVGYVATRSLGSRRGLLITGLAGGFISASITTASMGRISRTSGRLAAPLGGAYLASVATFVQLAGIIAVADAELLAHLWPAIVAGGSVLVVVVAVTLTRGAATVGADHPPDPDRAVDRPFGVRPALVLAGVLTTAVFVGRWVADVIGPNATVLAAGAAGLADSQAGALAAATLHEQGELQLTAALLGVGAAVCTNTVVKCVLAFTVGGRRFGMRFSAGAIPAFALFLGVLGITAAAI
ncbi:MAG: DUF4010 domain-containing protein [Actinomycetota bacterium]